MEEKRGAKKQPRLKAHEKQAITMKARSAKKAQQIVKVADDTLGAGTPANIKITPEQYQIILTRVTGGETVRQVCEGLALPHGAVYARSAYDTEFQADLQGALEIGQHSLVDYMLEISLDQSIPVERARLLSDNIKWTAGRRNRTHYGEKLSIDARVQHVPVILPQDFIDAQVLDDEEES